jgi:RNA polymerase sigma factor (sigma-70 family)
MNPFLSYSRLNRIDKKVPPKNQPDGTQGQQSDTVLAQPNQHAKQLRIALVDGDEGVYAAVKKLAKSENWNAEYYSDSDHALQHFPRIHPDVVLINIEMSGLSGIDCAQKLKCFMPALPVVMLTDRLDFDNFIASLMVGAAGYLLKPLSPEQLRNAIPSVIGGGTVLCEEAQTIFLSCLRHAFTGNSTAAFTERERQILTCLMQNMCDKDIGRHLKIETNTVHVHIVRLFQRLGVHSRREAVQKFFQRCLKTSCQGCNCSQSTQVPSRTPTSNKMERPHLPVFVTTRWSVVLSAGHGDTTDGSAALENLCRTYWYPLYAYVRRRGHSPEDAQDLTQEFFARLLKGNWVERADPHKGKFRSFLLSVMNHFLADEWDKARALKRGGGMTPLPLEFNTAEARYSHESADNATPEHIYERRWALALLEEVLRRLRSEYEQDGRTELFAELNPCLVGERTSQAYAELAEKLGVSEGTVKSAVYRLRQRYRQLLREEIAHTVVELGEVDEELQHLFIVLGSR